MDEFDEENQPQELDYKEALKAIICPETLIEKREEKNKYREKSQKPLLRNSRFGQDKIVDDSPDEVHL